MTFGSLSEFIGYLALNAYIISKDICLSSQNRRQFLIKLGEELCAPERIRQNKMLSRRNENTNQQIMRQIGAELL